ncbi:MAG: S49 family peptidase [Acidiferrobacterales bacterium]
MSEISNESSATQERETARQKWEQSLLERLAFASLAEQRKSRRWGIFFKSFFALYLVILLLLALTAGVTEKPLTGKYTALVDLDGIIGAESLASADNVVSGLRGAFDSGAKGVILRTNSPGGSPVQASYINNEIRRLREEHPDTPLYAVIGDVCASGCYYAVVAADKIYANKSSIVGSIGVLMNGFGFVETLEKLGIERRLLTAGKDKGFLDPFSPLVSRHRQHAQEMLEDIHKQFIDVVKQGRGEMLKADAKVFSGLFWTGEEALRMGLIDEFGSAGYVAREVIGAEDIVEFTHRESILDRFARRIGTAIAKTFATLLVAHLPQLH